jgi:hypothetical protein
MALPDFIVAGVRRCGTTWLHQCLKEHPDIALPAATKELFFFDRNWDRGADWYEPYFRNCPPGKMRGEVSPSYFSNPDTPARIKSLLPDVKLVFVLRNPLERVISLYHHLHLSGDIASDLRDALETHQELLDEGFYARHVERFRREFSDNRIFVLVREDVNDGGLAPLFSFLRVRDDFRPPSLHARLNKRREARSKFPAIVAARLSRALHHSGLHRAVTLAKAAGVERLLVRRRSLGKESVSAEIAKRVRAIYDEDAKQLGSILGRDLDRVWKY